MTADQDASSSPRKPQKGRSPSYPGISLKAAVERARIIYQNEGRRDAPLPVITGYWGFSAPTTGPASITYAALRKFGLITDEGSGASRMAKLTDLALDILMNPEPLTAIQKAALTPAIHRELWEQYGDELPPDASLRYRLVVQGGFTERGFQEFIREYRETITYAQLSSAASLDGEKESSEGQDNDRQAEKLRDPQDRRGGVSGNVLTIPIPIVGGKPVTIEGEFPISEAAWTQLLAVLNAMKPGLVREPEPDNAE